jgi:uncharacterized protein YaeQ
VYFGGDGDGARLCSGRKPRAASRKPLDERAPRFNIRPRMALTATVHRWSVVLSDVDRSTYETLDLRLARHPSESVRYLLTRTLAYCLSFEDGIAFSKGGLSDADEPPVSVFDPTGARTAWIDVGVPSAERLHKASKSTPRVAVFTHADVDAVRREAARRPVHRAEAISVWRVEPALLDALEPRVERAMELEVVRTEGRLYVTLAGAVHEGAITRAALAES